MEDLRKEQETLKHLKIEVEKLRPAVSQSSANTVTTSPNSSGQPESKRQRLDAKETMKRDDSSTIEVIDLSP